MTIFPSLLFLTSIINKLLIGSVCAFTEHSNLFKLFHFLEHSCVFNFTLDCVHCNIFEDVIDSTQCFLTSNSRLAGRGHSRSCITFWTKHNLNLLLFGLVNIAALIIVVLRILDKKSSNILVVLRHLIQMFGLGGREFSFRYLMFGYIFSVA